MRVGTCFVSSSYVGAISVTFRILRRLNDDHGSLEFCCALGCDARCGSLGATWAARRSPLLGEQTLRQIDRISRGGSERRVRFSNALGKRPLRIHPPDVVAVRWVQLR